MCAGCHGPTGDGTNIPQEFLGTRGPGLRASIDTDADFLSVTSTRMPYRHNSNNFSTDDCKDQCAIEIQDWLAELNGWVIATASSSSVTSSTISSGSSSSQQAVDSDYSVSFIAINAGGPELTADGVVFAADYGFTDGGVGTTPGAEADGLFKTERWNATNYAIPVPNGTYAIEVGFTELLDTHSVGSRVFNVVFEGGQAKLENIDPYKEAGEEHRGEATREITGVNVGDGELNITFEKIAHNPTLSFIHIKRGENIADQYDRMCSTCHGGPDGSDRTRLGDALVASTCLSCSDRSSLISKINDSMPFEFANTCTGSCAEDMADYILDNFAGYNGNAPANLPPLLNYGGNAGACSAPDTAVNHLRRVATIDYDHMIRDLFGIEDKYTAGFTADQRIDAFFINADRTVEKNQVIEYFSVAERVVTKALENKNAWKPAGCSSDNDACADAIITSIGRRAFRKPLSSAEHADLKALYNTAKSTADASVAFDRGIGTALQAILTSPRFLYYVEEGKGTSGVVELTQYELAARMALFLWRSLPDDALLDAAANNALSGDQLKQQIARMLADPKARNAVTLFHKEWMHIVAPTNGAEGYNQATALLDGFEQTIAHLVFDQATPGNFTDLWSVNYDFVNADSRTFYGSTSPIAGSQHSLDASRTGILTREPFLRSNKNPTTRGAFVRTEVFCGFIPSPPPGAAEREQVDLDGLNPRELFAVHTQDPGCGGCHRLMDPLGFPLDNFDKQGQWRDTHGGFPVDTTGEFVLTDINSTFNTAIEMQAGIALSQQASQCYNYKWFEFALGREGELNDNCSLGQINEQLQSGNGSILDLLTAIISSDAFRHRSH